MDTKNKNDREIEFELTREYVGFRDDTKRDLNVRLNGVPARAGGSGYQFAGYTTLERFYRGDQWDHDEPAGASQKTDNYCAVIVDNLSSLLFDDVPEVNCPTDDPTDDFAEFKAELKEDLIKKVYDDNDAEVELDELSKVGSIYGDTFIFGPYMEKDKKGKWQIKFTHVENPGAIRPIFSDANFKKLIGFIYDDKISLARAKKLYGAAAEAKGIVLDKEIKTTTENKSDADTNMPMVVISNYWTDEVHATFINDKILSKEYHNWGFVPLEYIKNSHSPNHPYGKSDLEDLLDPQLSHNRVNNDLANLLKWISTVNFWGKNVEGMQAMVAGLSRIYSLPEDGELHTFEKPGDPYITNTYAQQRRDAIVDISGVSDAMLSSSQVAAASGRSMALAFQGTLRKLNPRMKRYASALQNLNRNILTLYEIYFPETKKIIDGDYRNKVYLPATILRNIVDTINKLQSGIISLDTAQREAGVRQPRLEQKLIKKNLSDPILGGQIARQPQLLPRLSEGQNQGGEMPMAAPGNAPVAGAEGAVAMNNQQSSGAAPVPVE